MSEQMQEDFPYEYVLRGKPDVQTQDKRPDMRIQTEGDGHWTWQPAVELFYVETGSAAYDLPSGRQVFEEGEGGFLNQSVLHKFEFLSSPERTMVHVHRFRPRFLGDGAIISRKYITPLTMDRSFEILKITEREDTRLIRELVGSFSLPPDRSGYEMILRSQLSRIWIQVFFKAQRERRYRQRDLKTDQKTTQMLQYIYEHYDERLTVGSIAAAGYVSERECYRIFRENLHATPQDTVLEYRVSQARRMLCTGKESVTDIAYACGFRNNSYFCKIFKKECGISPIASGKNT